jgi:hypothetical protein
MALWE